jgi:hypothetical protein
MGSEDKDIATSPTMYTVRSSAYCYERPNLGPTAIPRGTVFIYAHHVNRLNASNLRFPSRGGYYRTIRILDQVRFTMALLVQGEYPSVKRQLPASQALLK